MKYIMADTCLWVDFFKDKDKKEKKSTILEELIYEDRVFVSDIIIAEILLGAKTEKEFNLLKNILSGLRIPNINSELFTKAGRLGFSLRKKGITVPLTDIIIAVQCLDNSLSIWSYDSHFKVIAENSHLELFVDK